eukprot:4324716-Prymnesium_polylepis.1
MRSCTRTPACVCAPSTSGRRAGRGEAGSKPTARCGARRREPATNSAFGRASPALINGPHGALARAHRSHPRTS